MSAVSFHESVKIETLEALTSVSILRFGLLILSTLAPECSASLGFKPLLANFLLFR